MRTKPEQMAGDAIQLSKNGADVPRPGRGLDIQQLLDSLTVAQPVRDRRNIIHAVYVWVELHPGAVLGNLFDSAVQVADDAIRAQNLFAIELQYDAQHAVRGWVLRP